ncbi:ParA family protein [Campylobacter cuniculorum]|uniref:Partitioning protein ParA n=2 Tax=Campylobacter cuniculorum TaxID=374106 RepID=A0A1W6BYH7_9BACT|nr:ParA family protein [Campylobacter cuniculorum]ARJ57156.1 partitioning protein ParA [Campylobacter cuniculorum DSM 23162 = LMG 24588]QOR04598.1 ParA family protein [Campylobacter cuniculorum]
MIIAVVNEKGGSGKTSLAINLACKLSDEGDKCALIDTDAQKSAKLWVELRKAEKKEQCFKYYDELNENIKGFDSVVIDTGGRDSKEMREALSKAHLVLIPTYPSQYDLAVLSNMIKLYENLHRENSRCFIVMNRAFTNACLKHKLKEFKELVRHKIKDKNIKILESVLYDREKVRVATTQGLGITQMQGYSKAKKDFEEFFAELLEEYNKD